MSVSETTAQLLHAVLRQLLTRYGARHAVMAVERGDGSARWRGAVGIAKPDRRPMQADTPFHIASIDKLFTAAVVMKLHERGALALDAPIVGYLPQTLIRGVHRLGGVDYTAEITARHLLAHTSGLADCFEDRPRGGRSLMQQILELGDRDWSLGDLTQLVRTQLTPHFPPQPLEAARPKVRYSDTNYQLLNALIETVTGKALHAVFEALLFKPLRMQHSYLFGRSHPSAPTPAPATLWMGKQPLRLLRALRAFPSVYSTLDDNMKFLRALLHGGLFDSPATLAMMQARWNRFGLPRDAAALRAPSWPIEYGLGMMRFALPRVFSPLRPMPPVIGHSGSTGAWLFYCPAQDLYLCGTIDQIGAGAGAVPYRTIPKLLRIMR